MAEVLEVFAAARLQELADADLLRRPDDGRLRCIAVNHAERLNVPFIDASSNDYLGLADVVSRETHVQGVPVGAGASRLIHGTREAHVVLESALAAWVGLPASLLFTSGYAANVGVLTALGRPGTAIISDRLNHASIIDGCRLSRATCEVVPHLDVLAARDALVRHSASAARWVVVESCYSMDGDGPDLRALRELCDEYDAGLIVDEAHSLGVFGPSGAGRCAAAGVVPDVLVGMLGKAVGAQGAFAAGSTRLRELLWNDARSFVFSTALSPRLAAEALLHVEHARAADIQRAKLQDLANDLRAQLSLVTTVFDLRGPILPVLVGENGRALRVVDRLAEEGILAQAIRPPTVPPGSARLRLTVKASWPEGATARIARTVTSALAKS